EHVAHGLDAHRSFGLQPRELAQLQLLVGVLRIAPAQRPQRDHDEHGQGRKPRKDDRADDRKQIIRHPPPPTPIPRTSTKSEQQDVTDRSMRMAGPAAAGDAARGVRAVGAPLVRIDRVPATAYIATMALRDILILPDKRLRQASDPVKKIDAGIRKLIEDMFETMYDAPGIGLAAIQVGTPKGIITMDLAKKEEPKNPQVFINPEILWTSEEKATYEEGCLSIPEYYSDVERPAQVKVKYLDREGEPREIEANGLFATCLQHEIDH